MMTINSNKYDYIKRGCARQVGTTRRSVSGLFPLRNGTAVAYESLLERDFIARTDFSLSVLDIIPQPTGIPFKDHQGRNQTYIPDFLVYYLLGDRHHERYPKPLLVEVKPQEKWKENWRLWLPKWKAAWRFAQDQGYSFHIYDESRIRDQTFRNIKFLERYKMLTFCEEESLFILNALAQRGQASFDFLLNFHFVGQAKASGISHIWHLLAMRRLDCDISLPLSNKTELWIPYYER